MPRHAVDETGRTYGRLIVLGRAPDQEPTHAYWLCRCECGRLAIVGGAQLRAGKTRSCGCYNLEVLRARLTTHGQATVGNRSRANRIWNAMKSRCTNRNQPHYERYGGRGVKVCDEWNASFEAFYRDMGDPPTPQHCIDRIDNDGPYEPGNCKWSTPAEQRMNQRPRRYRVA
jgi:hypothetical protein